ncbi:MAG: hypothetical protein IKX31_06680 [Muribaculaceae bacterium]|nr:hypothetical protein [Muribaculaceae bacterium]
MALLKFFIFDTHTPGSQVYTAGEAMSHIEGLKPKSRGGTPLLEKSI